MKKRIIKDYYSMPKQELKDYINENGFFSQAQMNLVEVSEKRENGMEITNKIPTGENIFIYNGLISQNYGKGEKNRNGYKIDPNGWLIDEYKLNPVILLMHNTELGPIGNMIQMRVTKDGLEAQFRIDINNISDEGIKNQIRTGVLKASSTGSLVNKYNFEDNKGKQYSEEQAQEKFGEREVFLAFMNQSDELVINVVESVMLETSLVTIGSNYKAVSNTLDKYFNSLVKEKMTLKPNAVTDVTEKEVATTEGTNVNTTDEKSVEVEVPETIEPIVPEVEVENKETAPGEDEKIDTDVAPAVEENQKNDESEPKGDNPEEPKEIDPENVEVNEAMQELQNQVNLLKTQNEALQKSISEPVLNTSLSKNRAPIKVVNAKEIEVAYIEKIFK